MTGALEGVRVLDLSRVVAGPVCASTLGDLGADVIKVEGLSHPDETRGWKPPRIGNLGLYFAAVNRNKRAITLNLKDPRGLAILRRLITGADVLIENFTTGTLARLGLGEQTLRELNPGLIHCGITGYGKTGPDASLPGYDILAQAASGFMSVNGDPEGDPVKAPIALADLLSGMNAAIGVLAALHSRERTGRGQSLDIALLDGMVAALLNVGSAHINTGEPGIRFGNEHQTLVPYQNFSTADGQIIIAVGNDEQFLRLCTALERPDIAADERFATASARIVHRAQLIPLLQDAGLRSHTSATWTQRLRAVHVPCGPINDLAGAFTSEQAQARGYVVSVPHPDVGELRLLASPVRLSETPVTYRRSPPGLGEHNYEVLGELGLSVAEVDRLRETGAL